jgi:hypothetical protein
LNATLVFVSDHQMLKPVHLFFKPLLCVALGGAVVAVGLRMPAGSVYQAVARTKVSPPAFPGPWFPQTEFEVISSEVVLGKVIKKLNLAQDWGRKRPGGAPLKRVETLQTLKRKLHLEVVRGTELVEIRIRSDAAAEAAKIANSIAETFCDWRHDQDRRLRIEEKTAHPTSATDLGMMVDPMVDIVDRASVPMTLSVLRVSFVDRFACLVFCWLLSGFMSHSASLVYLETFSDERVWRRLAMTSDRNRTRSRADATLKAVLRRHARFVLSIADASC